VPAMVNSWYTARGAPAVRAALAWLTSKAKETRSSTARLGNIAPEIVRYSFES